jgi:antitoxin MazE
MTMPKVFLTKWGNSVGIRIPAVIIKEAHLASGAALNLTVNKQGALTLIPIKDEQKGWKEQFNAIADAKADDLLLDLDNAFDEEEWTW